jgi:hypothetical protein
MSSIVSLDYFENRVELRIYGGYKKKEATSERF